MRERGRTGNIRRAERLEQVRGALCGTLVPFDLRVDADQDSGGRVRSADLGVVRVAHAPNGTLAGEVIRTTRLIRRSDPDMCKIDVQLHGRTILEQDRRQAELNPGDFTFVDLSRPCRLAGDLKGVAVVMFPRALLPLPYRDTRRLAGVTFQAPDAHTALVHALVGQVAPRVEEYTGVNGSRVGAAMFDVITAALAARLGRVEAVSRETRARALIWHIKTFIEERLGDPGLSPPQIAAAHHISLRHLYRLFDEQEMTVGAWIRTRRLERCHRDLTDPTLLDRPASAIGARWGLVDATQFSRAFRARYGLPPGRYRRAWSEHLN